MSIFSRSDNLEKFSPFYSILRGIGKLFTKPFAPKNITSVFPYNTSPYKFHNHSILNTHPVYPTFVAQSPQPQPKCHCKCVRFKPESFSAYQNKPVPPSFIRPENLVPPTFNNHNSHKSPLKSCLKQIGPEPDKKSSAKPKKFEYPEINYPKEIRHLIR